MTGAEVLGLLGRIGPGIDLAYRDELVERFALDLAKPAGTYSTGNRQKVALVAAFATRAPLLVLDEPTSGLDPLMEREFRRAVEQARGNGQTVFLRSHQLAEVEAVCDRVAILRAGRLVDVASVAQLRRLHRSEVSVTFTGPAPDPRRDTRGRRPDGRRGADAAVHVGRLTRPGAASVGGRGRRLARGPGAEPLAGRATLAGAVRHHVGVLALVPLVTGGITAPAMIAAGTGVTGALLHGSALAAVGVFFAGAGGVAVGVFFAGAGGVAAQVFPSRSAASGGAAAVLVVGVLARMVGDGVTALSWLRWCSPFGLAALARPFDTNRGLPLVVLSLAALALLAAAAWLATRRDVGGAILAPSTGRAARRALLGSVRRSRYGAEPILGGVSERHQRRRVRGLSAWPNPTGTQAVCTPARQNSQVLLS